MIKFIITFILTFNICFAQNAVIINKNDLAPYSGVLVKEEKFNSLVKSDKKVLLLEDLAATKDDIIIYHKKDANLQRTKLSEAKFDSNIKSIGMFVLGVVLSGFAFTVTEKIKDI